MVQSNYGRSTNKTGNATEKVTGESFFNPPQSLTTGKHPASNVMREKEVQPHTEVTGCLSSFWQGFVETQSSNGLQIGADKFMEATAK